jgi:hypothetical protein
MIALGIIVSVIEVAALLAVLGSTVAMIVWVATGSGA